MTTFSAKVVKAIVSLFGKYDRRILFFHYNVGGETVSWENLQGVTNSAVSLIQNPEIKRNYWNVAHAIKFYQWFS